MSELFKHRLEPEFRRAEEEFATDVLASSKPAVIAIGGGAILSERTRERLLTDAFTLWMDVDVAGAWTRVRNTGRPLAQDRERFWQLFEERQPLYEAVSAERVETTEDVLLAALEIQVGRGQVARLPDVLGLKASKPLR